MKIDFHEEGQADYLGAIALFKAQSRARGAAFAAEFRAAIATIATFPYSCRADESGVRKKTLRHFPHVIVYRLENDDVIKVYAVAHPRRDEYWRDRL